MRIYSNSFFHYTSSLDFLQHIISDGFKIYFCKEEVYSDGSYPLLYIGIPLVSFCDLPLSFIAENNYGSYGIGMSRKWGISRKLVPVSYYPNNKDCFSTKTIIKAAKSFIAKTNPSEYSILGTSKPLYKIKPISGKKDNNYIEREWRRVFYSIGDFKWKDEAEYDVYRGLKSSPKTSVGGPMVFTSTDIDFIIAPEAERMDLVNYIMHTMTQIGGSPLPISLSDREGLVSRVVTYEQLKRNI